MRAPRRRSPVIAQLTPREARMVAALTQLSRRSRRALFEVIEMALAIDLDAAGASNPSRAPLRLVGHPR
jgi:hypothetical protein